MNFLNFKKILNQEIKVFKKPVNLSRSNPMKLLHAVSKENLCLTNFKKARVEKVLRTKDKLQDYPLVYALVVVLVRRRMPKKLSRITFLTSLHFARNHWPSQRNKGVNQNTFLVFFILKNPHIEQQSTIRVEWEIQDYITISDFFYNLFQYLSVNLCK